MYASPYAGAYFNPFADDLSFPRYTYTHYDEFIDFLQSEQPGTDKTWTEEHFSESLNEEDVSGVRQFIPDLSIGHSDKPGCSLVVTFTGITFNPPLLTANLVKRFKELGVKFIRKKLSSLDEAFGGGRKKAVINCSGLGSQILANDDTVFPTRGQVVVIRAPHIKKVVTAWTPEDSTYVIPRPNSHEVVLGGFYQPHRFDPNTYGDESDDILRRTLSLCPEILLQNDISSRPEIIRQVAGARPSRSGGVRIDRENAPLGPIIHNYGAGGLGYICSLGMAHRSVKLMISEKN